MYSNNNTETISKSTLINTLKNIDSALQAERYVFNSYYNGHIPLINRKTAHAQDIFGPSPLGSDREIWIGWSVPEFESRGVNTAYNKANYFRNGLSIRLYSNGVVGYITIDDIDGKTKFKHASKYHFALKIRTSEYSFQGVLKINLPNKNRENEIYALREAAQILNHAFGDKEVRSSSQIFRFPNTYNNKEKHKSEKYPHGFIVKLCHAENIFCQKAQKLFDVILKQIEKGSYVKFLDKVAKKSDKKTASMKQNSIFSNNDEYAKNTKVEHEPFTIEDHDFKPLFAENGRPWHIYYAQAHALYYEFKKREKKPLQGRNLDDFVAARLKILGYSRNQIAIIIGTACSGKNAEIRAKDNPHKIPEYQNRSNRQIAMEKGRAVANNAFNDHVLINYGEKFAERISIVNECKKKEIYWCDRFTNEENNLVMKM